MDPDNEWQQKVQDTIHWARVKRKTNDDNLPEVSLPPNFTIDLARNEQDIASWVAKNRAVLLGVDLEWKADFKIGGHRTSNPACFLQLSTLESCLVIDLREMENCDSPSIKNLFAGRILKLGIGTEQDKQKFQAFFPGYQIQSWLDLAVVAKEKFNIRPPGNSNGQMHGVHSLCTNVLKQFFVDTPELTFTNWSAVEIDAQHLNYMALDAWLCTKIGFELAASTQQKATTATASQKPIQPL